MLIKDLNRRHPDHKKYAESWEDIDALYDGGMKLLKGDRTLLAKWGDETDASFSARRKKAFYENHFAAVVDYIVAQLKSEPITVMDVSDDIYAAFIADCTADGDERLTFSDFLAEQVRAALLYQRIWTRIDLPEGDPSLQTEGEQRAAGKLAAKLCSIDNRCVLNWSVKASQLAWVIVYNDEVEQLNPEDKARTRTQTWTVYGPATWSRFEHVSEEKAKIDENVDVPLVASGAHTFARCPLILFDLTNRLWIGDKVESLAREHFNRINNHGEFQRKAAHPQLYEFNAPSMPGIDEPINEHQEDVNRSRTQPRGPGLVQVRGSGDKAAYISPDAAMVVALSGECDKMREAIYRVTYQMALSQDNKGALIRRSAESKGIDNAATGIILTALGTRVRAHALDILNTYSRGIGDTKTKHQVVGASEFETTTANEVIERAVQVAVLAIPSPTLKKEVALDVARAVLTGRDEAVFEQIQSELEIGFTIEEELANEEKEPARIGP